MNHFKKNYALLLENFHFYENRKFYLELMERFIDKRIDGRQFDIEFYKMWCVDCQKTKTYSSKELLHKIEDVDFTKSEGFSALMSKLFSDCEVFEPDSALREYFEISEEELRNGAKRTLLEIKNRYPLD